MRTKNRIKSVDELDSILEFDSGGEFFVDDKDRFYVRDGKAAKRVSAKAAVRWLLREFSAESNGYRIAEKEFPRVIEAIANTVPEVETRS